VKSAATAEEALKLAAKHEFDLVISDIGLPDQTGLELMHQLKDQFNLRGISLSGYGAGEDLVKSQTAGFAIQLVKPVRFADLKQAILEMDL
jgi:YesN/AraC family two-component response regulator